MVTFTLPNYFTTYGKEGEDYGTFFKENFDIKGYKRSLRDLCWSPKSLIDFGCATGESLLEFGKIIPNVKGYELFDVRKQLKCLPQLWNQGDARIAVKNETCDVAYISFLMYFKKAEVEPFLLDLFKCVKQGVIFENLYKDDHPSFFIDDELRVPKEEMLTLKEFRTLMSRIGFIETPLLDYWFVPSAPQVVAASSTPLPDFEGFTSPQYICRSAKDLFCSRTLTHLSAKLEMLCLTADRPIAIDWWSIEDILKDNEKGSKFGPGRWLHRYDELENELACMIFVNKQIASYELLSYWTPNIIIQCVRDFGFSHKWEYAEEHTLLVLRKD